MDLDHGAMMVAIIAVLIQPVRGHELDNLNRASAAIDVRNIHVGFDLLVELRGVGKKPVSENGWNRRVMDDSRHRPGTFARVLGLHLGIGRKFVARVHRQRDSIEAGMEDRLAKPDVELVAALDLGDRAGGLARIGRGPATRCLLLRVAKLGLFKPRGRLEQPEMRANCGGQCDHRNGTKEQALRKFHASEYTTSRAVGRTLPSAPNPQVRLPVLRYRSMAGGSSICRLIAVLLWPPPPLPSVRRVSRPPSPPRTSASIRSACATTFLSFPTTSFSTPPISHPRPEPSSPRAMPISRGKVRGPCSSMP